MKFNPEFGNNHIEEVSVEQKIEQQAAQLDKKMQLIDDELKDKTLVDKIHEYLVINPHCASTVVLVANLMEASYYAGSGKTTNSIIYAGGALAWAIIAWNQKKSKKIREESIKAAKKDA